MTIAVIRAGVPANPAEEYPALIALLQQAGLVVTRQKVVFGRILWHIHKHEAGLQFIQDKRTSFSTTVAAPTDEQSAILDLLDGQANISVTRSSITLGAFLRMQRPRPYALPPDSIEALRWFRDGRPEFPRERPLDVQELIDALIDEQGYTLDEAAHLVASESRAERDDQQVWRMLSEIGLTDVNKQRRPAVLLDAGTPVA